MTNRPFRLLIGQRDLAEMSEKKARSFISQGIDGIDINLHHLSILSQLFWRDSPRSRPGHAGRQGREIEEKRYRSDALPGCSCTSNSS